ncbi:mitochondrial inner membrane protein required for protein import [Coemansia sp. RSA 922]|nr:mitochondrial inner membrane protein required for protein import [Coemansia sp. S680]KAJ2033732.1 mitochondrial inner membrane protein required for protein import [Coemansia sp. S3946]KAJ2045373.1 mitochondrial inner membrane protein required for protein import [Coemansia sp. S16]KAJ2112591.1 mitochondrial inner membrane protein required for protein import [Coemansia sp. RSA 922]
MLGRITTPISRQLRPAWVANNGSRVRVAAGLLQARGLSATTPAMIRIKKTSETTPPKTPSSEETAKDESTTNTVDDSKVDPSADAATSSQKPSSTSPFGFSSAGSGIASGILTGDEAATDSADGQDGKGQHPRDSASAAEARRARRQRADLPPLEDEPKVKAAKYIGTGLVFGLLVGGIGYYGRPFTADEAGKGMKDDPEQNALQQLWHRAFKRTQGAFSFLSEPATEKLLSDPNEYTMPYTLVLNLDDMLIHMDWTKEHGWRIAKRPGLDHFLAYMASMFELVIFSTQPSHSGMLVMERLDPMEYAPFRLYKDHMRNIDGKNYKDLTTINRDMSKVIMIDISPDSLKMQPDNVLMARPFRGEPGDNWIEQITELLEYIHMMEPKDVRAWIKVYKGLDAAHEFTKWENVIRKKTIDDWEEKRKNAGSLKSLIFGGAPADTENPPVPEFDQMRKLMRENFAVQHKEVLAIIEKERKDIEEEMKRQMKDMTLWKMMKQWTSGAPPDAPAGTSTAPAQK